MNNGQRALELLEAAFDEEDPMRYCLILIECKMPIMDGFETTKRLKQLYDGIGLPKSKQPLIVATTCMSSLEQKERVKSSNFDKVLAKPISIEKFSSLLLQLQLIDSIPSLVSKFIDKNI